MLGKEPEDPKLNLIRGKTRRGNTYISQGRATEHARKAAEVAYNKAVDEYNRINSAPRAQPRTVPITGAPLPFGPVNRGMMGGPGAGNLAPKTASPRTVIPNFKPISRITRSPSAASKAIADAASLKGTRVYQRNRDTGQTQGVQVATAP